MSNYQPLLICRECGKRKPRNYFISETLCKKCAAKRRVSQPNPLRTIAHPSTNVESNTESLTVTERVVKRLRRQAEHGIPKTARDHLGDVTPFAIIAGFWAIGFIFGFPSLGLIRDKSLHFILIWTYIMFLMFWYTLVPILIGVWVQSVLDRPRSKKVDLHLYELAKERAKAISDARSFYASAEWNIIRTLVLKETPHKCQDCGKMIRKKSDLTVDHVLPRNKYPNLALERSNMRVLCRTCNSKKGDRVLSNTYK
jgi:hypothetical protein